jgi:hypothetical protein
MGTRRRRAPQARVAVPEAGASRFRESKAPSLDTEKQLATTVFDNDQTVADWSKSEETPADRNQNRFFLYKQLQNTVSEIHQKHMRIAKLAMDSEGVDDKPASAWWEACGAAKLPQGDESTTDRWKRVEK